MANMNRSTLLEMLLNQHLKSYVLIGYDHEGCKCVATRYDNQMEYDALVQSMELEQQAMGAEIVTDDDED